VKSMLKLPKIDQKGYHLTTTTTMKKVLQDAALDPVLESRLEVKMRIMTLKITVLAMVLRALQEEDSEGLSNMIKKTKKVKLHHRGNPRAPRPRRPIEDRNNSTPSKTTLFVANLPFALDDVEFGQVFSEEGLAFKSAHVVKKRNLRSKGFGFVEFENEADQQKALQAINNKTVKERELIVKVALTEQKHREEPSPPREDSKQEKPAEPRKEEKKPEPKKEEKKTPEPKKEEKVQEKKPAEEKKPEPKKEEKKPEPKKDDTKPADKKPEVKKKPETKSDK